MKYFVQLKDNVVFACHQSETEVDVEGDNTYEVFEEGEHFLGKKYDNGNFIEAPVIRYAILDSNNTVIMVKSTVFSSDIGDNKIIEDNVDLFWTWNGSEFIAPEGVDPLGTIFVDSQRVTTSDEIPALTQSELDAMRAYTPAEIENPIEDNSKPLEEVVLEQEAEAKAFLESFVDPNKPIIDEDE